jgi:ABC-type polysaccharide/polyol phosphate export permease
LGSSQNFPARHRCLAASFLGLWLPSHGTGLINDNGYITVMAFSSSAFNPFVDGEDRRHAIRAARKDFVQGVMAWRMWLSLGIQDVRIRYKRTYLGPLWITASMAGTFIAMGMLFSAVLKNDVRIYLPYLAAGMVAWGFLTSVVSDGPGAFVSAQHIINALRLPFPVYVLRCIVRNGIVFLHNFAAAWAAYFILGGSLKPAFLLLLLTMPLLFASAFFVGLILAILGARFRDLGPSAGVVMQLLFFMTPIMWRPEDIPDASKWWVTINPVHHLLEVIRAPMLGGWPQALSLEIACGFTAALGILSFGLFCAYRHRISYWL